MRKALKPPKQMQHTGEPSIDTSNMIFPVELRSNTFEEFDTIISLWLIPDESTQKFLRPDIFYQESFLRKLTQAVCRVSGKARDGYQSGVVRTYCTVCSPLQVQIIYHNNKHYESKYRTLQKVTQNRPRAWDIAQIFQIF